LFSQSLKFTTPVVFSLLMALAPVVVLLLSAVFLKEVVPRRKIVGVLLSIFGAAMIILSSSAQSTLASNNAQGILFAILCVLCYSGYLVLTRKISIKYKPVTVAKWMFLFSALVVLPFSFSELPYQNMYSREATGMAYALLAFALLFSTTLAFFLMPLALKKLEASTVSVFMNIQPIVASCVAIVVGQDLFRWDILPAALFVLLGVYLVTTRKAVRQRSMRV
ncbi:MAG: EamA family transporter, partial [Phaeodactylibacter sp.]|nr:EamA family transporter [Phaeodactylibacter sp.]